MCNSNNEEKGYVYILTNPSFRENWVKIGKSSRPVDVRSKELDNTAVPLPFDIFATIQTKMYSELESVIHRQIDRLTDLRVRQNREFFDIYPEYALEILLDLAKIIPDAVVMKYDEKGNPHQVYPSLMEEGSEDKNLVVEKKKSLKATNFTFDKVGIKSGEKIIFIPLDLEVTVSGDNKVDHEGRLWSLTSFTSTFIPDDQKNHSGAYRGPKYFSYKGVKLSTLRDKMEKGMTLEEIIQESSSNNNNDIDQESNGEGD